MSLERGSSLRVRIGDLVDKRKGGLDPKDAFVNHVWPEVKGDYQEMADELAKLCKEELSMRKVPAAVESRVKSLASITKSLERREIYRHTRKEEPYRNLREILLDLHDLVGIRIIVDYLDQIKTTTDFITSTFHKEKEPNVFSANRKVGYSWTSWFGPYECTNHHVSTKYPESSNLSGYNGVIFEMQVTSLPVNLYNRIAHPLLYKGVAGELSQGDEIVIDLTKGLAFCYSLCTYYKRHKLDGKAFDSHELELMQKASSTFEGPEFMSSISDLAGRIPGIDVAEIKGKSIPRERLEMVLESLLIEEIQSDIGQSVANQLRQEIKDISRPRIELHAFGRARFDSQDVYQSPVCQQGTQTGAISYIHKWIEEGKESLLWVCSHAGSGKSTLARTIARNLTKTGQIAGGYFFRRGDVGRNHIRHVIPTIAAQLILTIPQYECCLRESIDACKNTDFENMLLLEQFRVLLQTPLSHVGRVPSTKLIIIDALDESVDLVQLEQVMDLLVGLKNCSLTRFRLLVTSRDEEQVRAAIIRHPHKKLSLSTRYRDDNISDIESILRVGFQRIRKDRRIEETWPTEEQFREVLRRSTNPSPLFIYATTILRFLGDGTRLGRPRIRLQSWMDKSLSPTFTTQLDEIYTTVFENLDPDLGPGDSENLTEDEKDSLRMVLGAIALAAEPLSVNSLLAILGLEPDVVDLLNACRAVLYIPDDNDEPVQMLHKPFSGFLLRQPPQRKCWFNVDERKQNELLAQGCIKYLEGKLRVNICQLENPAVLRTEIQPSIVQKYIPNSIQYASSCWIQHAQSSGDMNPLAGMIESFLHKKFLEWTECMAILGRLDRVASAMQDLRVCTRSEDRLGRFLYDAYRFLLKHGPIIQKTPRQAYGSALLFSPANSIVRNTFWHQRLAGCQDSFNVPENWDSLLQRIRLLPDDFSVNELALSSDGKRLAVSHHTEDSFGFVTMGFIDLWQPLTGTHLSRTKLLSAAAAMCWDKDGENLIFLTYDGQVYRLDFFQDKPISISSSSFRFVYDSHVAISSTGLLISSHSTDCTDSLSTWSKDGNNCRVSVWDSITGKSLHVWMSMAKVSAIAISRDSSHAAIVSDGIVKLGDTNTWSFSDLAKLSSGAAVLRFSPDGNRLFIVDLETVTMVSIYDKRSWTTQVSWHSLHHVVVFPDNKTFATEYHNDLLLWNIEQSIFQQCEIISDQRGSASLAPSFYDATWEISHRTDDLKGSGETTNMTMSPDGQYLVSIYNNRIHMRQLPHYKLQKALVHGEPVRLEFSWGPDDTLNFSRDGIAILASCNSVVYIWLLEQKDSSEFELPAAAAISFPDPYAHDLYDMWGIKSIWLTGRKVALLVLNRVEIWDIQDGARRLHTFEPPQKHYISNIAFAPGSELLAIAYGSFVTVLSVGGYVCRQDLTMPLEIRALSFSPDRSMLFFLCEVEPESDNGSLVSIECDDDASRGRAIWTAVVCNGADPCIYHPGFISMPVKCLPSATDVRETISGSSQFILHDDPHSSDFDATEFLFSTDGMSVKLRSPSAYCYSVQHAKHLLPTSQSLSMVCEIDSPETQTWIRRGSQRVIQIPHGYARSCIGYGDKYVAMIDSRGEIVVLEFR